MAAALGAAATIAAAQQPAPAHAAVTPKDLVWGPAPPIFQPGAQVTVVSGDLAQPGPFVVRMKVPAGYSIKPHWHPTDENVTVLAGTVAMGTGDAIDEKAGHEMPTGSFMRAPAQVHHWLVVRSAAVLQVHGMGPFALTYVNPADDPSQAPKK